MPQELRCRNGTDRCLARDQASQRRAGTPTADSGRHYLGAPVRLPALEQVILSDVSRSKNDDDTVDPAALLTGVLAVAVVPLLERGEWVWLNSLIGIVVGSVIVAFYVTSWRWDVLGRPERLAVLAVLLVVLLVVLAKPTQDLFGRQCGTVSLDQLDVSRYTVESCEDANGDIGTRSAGCVACIAALLVLVIRPIRVKIFSRGSSTRG